MIDWDSDMLLVLLTVFDVVRQLVVDGITIVVDPWLVVLTVIDVSRQLVVDGNTVDVDSWLVDGNTIAVEHWLVVLTVFDAVRQLVVDGNTFAVEHWLVVLTAFGGVSKTADSSISSISSSCRIELLSPILNLSSVFSSCPNTTSKGVFFVVREFLVFKATKKKEWGSTHMNREIQKKLTKIYKSQIKL